MALKARKVIQCDKNGYDLRAFSSAKEAAAFFGSNYPSTISKAICHGIDAFGYRWRYEGETLVDKKQGTPGKRRPIVAVRESDKEELLFPSISKASRELDIGLTAIEYALQAGCLAKGYRFHYQGEGLKESYKSKRHRREVLALDEEGEVVATYGSAYDCAKEKGVIAAAVYYALNHPEAKCKGHRLRYKDADEKL